MKDHDINEVMQRQDHEYGDASVKRDLLFKISPRSSDSPFNKELESSVEERRMSQLNVMIKEQQYKRSQNYSSSRDEASMTNLANFTNSFTNKKPLFLPVIETNVAATVGQNRRGISKRGK